MVVAAAAAEAQQCCRAWLAASDRLCQCCCPCVATDPYTGEGLKAEGTSGMLSAGYAARTSGCSGTARSVLLPLMRAASHIARSTCSPAGFSPAVPPAAMAGTANLSSEGVLPLLVPLVGEAELLLGTQHPPACCTTAPILMLPPPHAAAGDSGEPHGLAKVKESVKGALGLGQ